MDEQIMNVLKKIREICKENPDCETCPFSIYADNDYSCAINTVRPDDWNFNEPIYKYFTE